MSTEINFTEIDPAALKDDFIARIESAIQEPLYPGDERRIFTEGVCYALAVFISAMNESCRARLLRYATGYKLDALGERVNCSRLLPIPSRTTLQFSLATERSIATVIPAGTRCTADSTILFATDASCTIPAGQISVAVSATATSGGSVTNGIPAGTVQTFVDDVPFVAGVVNLTESSGADDGEPYPVALDSDGGDDGTGDNHYRARIALAPAGFTTAGSESAYRYHAMSASATIADVQVVSDQIAGRIDLYVVETGGRLPDQDMLARVASAVSAEDVRPLNDLVVVSAPATVPYGIKLTYYCTQADESATVEAIEGAGGAIDQYIAWQDAVIGRDINPDQLRRLCFGSCVRVELSEPVFTAVTRKQIPRFNGEKEVTHIVISDE